MLMVVVPQPLLLLLLEPNEYVSVRQGLSHKWVVLLVLLVLLRLLLRQLLTLLP
jgi:hypothetical protein